MIFDIVEFIVAVALPGDVRLADCYNLIRCVFDLISIIEETLCDQATRDGGIIGDQSSSVNALGDTTEIFVPHNGVAIRQLLGSVDPFPVQLSEAARLDVATVVLVEIIELVINVDWAWDVFGDFELLLANCLIFRAAIIIVLNLDFLDLIAHDVQEDAKTQENHTENCEGDHGGAEGRNGSPGWEGLLLEAGALELLDLFADAKLLLFCDIHSFLDYNLFNNCLLSSYLDV